MITICRTLVGIVLTLCLLGCAEERPAVEGKGDPIHSKPAPDPAKDQTPFE